MRGIVFFFSDRLALNFELNQAPIQFVHHLGLGIYFDLDLGRRLVNQVNRLIGQETVGDVAVRQLSSRHDRWVGDFHAVVNFVAFLQSAQNGDGGLDAGFAHNDFLKTPLQGSVFFDELAVFIQGGSAHAMQLTTGQGRLEHVAGVHRAFGLARTHHGVQFINEHNVLALILGQLLEHRLQALFKFAPEFGTRQ